MPKDTRELEEYLEAHAVDLVESDEDAREVMRAARQDEARRKARAGRLQSLRMKQLHMTQKTLAKAVGANLRTLQSWERGRQDYPRSVEILMKLMRDVPAVRKKLVSGKVAA